MEYKNHKGSKNYFQTENITHKHPEEGKGLRGGLDGYSNDHEPGKIPKTDVLESSASNQLRLRYSSDQNLPIILEDRSGEKSGTERLSASAKIAQGRESSSKALNSHQSPTKRLNMSMFFDELTSRLQDDLKRLTGNLNTSQALQTFKSFAMNKQEPVLNMIYPEMSAIELYISDIFNVRLNEDEPLILDAYLGKPIQVFITGQEASRHIQTGASAEVVNVTQLSTELKNSIVQQVQKMQNLKFRDMMSAFETHIESRSVQSLEKVLNPKRLSSKPRLSAFNIGQDEQLQNMQTSPSNSQQGRPRSKLQLISQMVESFEARTSEDTDSLNNLDSKLADILDRIDRL